MFVEEEEIDNGMPQIQSKTPNKCVHTVSEAQQKSAPTTPEMKHKTSLVPVQKVRHHSVVNQSPNRKISYKDETLKFREYNLFNKKVPKDAEAANIQV